MQPRASLSPSLLRFTLRLSLGCAAAFLTALPARAHSIAFDQPADLTTHFTLTQAPALSISHQTTSGVNGSGALALTGSGNAEKSLSAVFHDTTFNATNSTRLQTSLFVNPAALNTTYGNNHRDRIVTRVGFSGANTPNLSEPKKFFDKGNNTPQILAQADWRVQHSSGNGFEFKAELRFHNGTGGESKTDQTIKVNFPGPYDTMVNWYRVVLNVDRTGSDTFTATLTVEDWGPQGNAFVAEVAHRTLNFTSATLAQDSEIFAAFTAELEKDPRRTPNLNGTFFLDQFFVTTSATPPDAPTVGEAAQIGETVAVLNWTAPATGVPASGYQIDLSTDATFPPGSLLTANGTTGQNAPILVSGAATTSLPVNGLVASTTYHYRVRATNAAGPGPNSAIASFTTAAQFINTPPTLDPIPPLPALAPDHGSFIIPLTGISPGFGDDGQTLSVTAISSDPAVIPHPTVSYTSPETTGFLTLTTTGTEGQTFITVTVDDGQAENNTVSRSLAVTVRTPPNLINFNTETDLPDEFTTSQINGTLSYLPDGGIGFPPTGGYRYTAANGSDNAFLALRHQPVTGNFPSSLATSLMVNFREIDDIPSGKHKAEVRLGISNENSPIPSDRKKFFDDSGSPTRRAIQVRLQAEHEPGKKDREIKLRAGSFIGNTKTESPEITVTGDEDAFNHWLRLSLVAVPISTTQIEILYRLEDLGPDGDDAPSLVAEGSLLATNPGFLAAPWLYPGFILTTEKGRTDHGLFFDNHTFHIFREVPGAPLAQTATNVTSHNLLARWTRGDGAVPLNYLVELSDSPAFTSFLAADGTPGQTSGVTVSSAAATSLQFTGLNPGTTYYYRLRGLNTLGASPHSEIVAVTTLPAGVNVPPTFDPIADLTLTPDLQQQLVPLTGITDGGELDQAVSFTAFSSNPALIPHPTISYQNPLTTGTLAFTPADGLTGSATITVTAHDGAPNNHTFSRTFTVTVAAPDPLVTFASPAQLDRYFIFTQNAALTHEPAAGAAWPSATDGAVRFDRFGPPTDRVAVAFRPEIYDARSTSYFVQSIMVRASDLASVPPGAKDKFDLRLGFLAEPLPGTTLKDTFNKSRPGIGARFKLETEPSDPSKTLLIEAESFSVTPSVSGFNESKGGKASLANLSALGSNWLRFTFQAIRRAPNQYELSWAIEDWGPDGSTFISRLLTGPAFMATNGTFLNDGNVFAGFQINGDKNGLSPLLVDNHEVIANTRAPDAPAIVPAFDITRTSFTLAWLASTIGRAVEGFLIEIVRRVDGFLSGLFLGADGSTQSAGILLQDPWEENLTITGLQPHTDYLWRVFAFNHEGTSLAFTPGQTHTLDFDFASWIEFHFDADEQLDPAISGPQADPDGDGIPNLLEFALGGDPRQPDRALTQTTLHASGQLLLTFKRRTGSSELLYIPEVTSDLHQTWSTAGIVIESVSAPDENGFETVTVRDTANPEAFPRRFIRLRVEHLP